MHETSSSTAALRDDGRRFTQVAFGLLALAALAFGLAVHKGVLPIDFDTQARQVIAWSFVGLSTLDATLLVIWERLIGIIARG